MTVKMAADHEAELFQPMFLFILLQLGCVLTRKLASANDIGTVGDYQYIEQDILLPYTNFHSPRHKKRHIRECQPLHYGNITYSIHRPQDSVDHAIPVVDSRRFVKNISPYSWDKQFVYGHHFVINNPHLSVSVLEPHSAGGCSQRLVSTVAETGNQNGCLVAVNAGFFNTTTHECIGNVVSNGKGAHVSGGIQNAHFGILKNGSLYFGYIPEEWNLEDTFSQLVGGVIWLVRDGASYVDYSKVAECPDSQETGNIQTFIDVQSGRTAVGHDSDGRLIILQVEGKSWQRGASLYDMANLMIELGAVNAINLDGGGSSTAVEESVLVNFPSDSCRIDNVTYGCARNVSTVLCVHQIECEPKNCSGHGVCIHAKCTCDTNWGGDGCNYLHCGKSNCSGRGVCASDGCECDPGWHGEDCSERCSAGTFGFRCKSLCKCLGTSRCHPETGQCHCPSGYKGYHCEESCPFGTYGENCRGVCDCPGGCTCNHVTGSCDIFGPNTTFWEVGQCAAQLVVVKRESVVIEPQEMQMWLVTVVVLCFFSVASILLNIALFCIKCQVPNKIHQTYGNANYRTVYKPSAGEASFSSSADDEYSDDSFENIALRRLTLKSETLPDGHREFPNDAASVGPQPPKSQTEPNLRCMLEL